MSNFMDDTVKSICDSMKNDPNRWKITTYTVNDVSTGVRYWLGNTGEPITQVWDGVSNNTVFSKAQGVLIQDAFSEMQKHKASEEQERVIKSMQPKPSRILYFEVSSQKKWWEFWK